jgi:molybdopterin adenylyltransferase
VVNVKIKIESVNISEKKGEIKKPVLKVLVDEKGITTDAHRGLWHRQISLLSLESIEKFQEEAGTTFEFGAFAENITISGIDLNRVSPFDKFIIGKVILEVTQIGKKCHGDGCAVYREVGKCVMPKEGIFARVLSGGEINRGDLVEYVQKPVNIEIITLSDRASSGEYKDLSGPLVNKLIQKYFQDTRWVMNIKNTIIPDDSELFEKILMESRSDLVFATGGTGIGPRDISPEVVEKVCDKMIPGIMEFIRMKYGANKPNALLSRSVAGVKDKTVIYAIPGSVKAVTEYMSEILKTIEHTILMLNGIGH